MIADRPTPGSAPSSSHAPEGSRSTGSGQGPVAGSPATPAPASMKGFLVLLLVLALVTTVAFLLLGDSWHRWFPRE